MLGSFPFCRSAPAPEGPGASGVAGSNRRLQQTQAQVDEVWAKTHLFSPRRGKVFTVCTETMH